MIIPNAEPSSHSWGPLAPESQPKQCRQAPGLAQMETLHLPGDLSWGKRILQIQPERPWAAVWGQNPSLHHLLLLPRKVWPPLSPPLPSVPRLGAALSLSPTARLNRPSSLPPPQGVGALIHNPLGSHCGVMAGSPCPPGTAQGQHHHLGALPAGPVAPACPGASAGTVSPVPEGLPSREDRPQQARDAWEAPSPHACQASRKEGTAGSVPPPPRAGSAEGQGSGHRHLPGSCRSTGTPPSASGCCCRGARARPGPRQSPSGSSRGSGCR